MFNNDKIKIQELWREEIYVRQNSITFNNGFCCLFELSQKENKITNKKWSPIADLLADESDTCEGLATIIKTELLVDAFVECGECLASGDDGFVAFTRKSTNELVWLLVLSETNPFESIDIKDELIVVTSSNGTTVSIPFERPDQLSIDWN